MQDKFQENFSITVQQNGYKFLVDNKGIQLDTLQKTHGSVVYVPFREWPTVIKDIQKAINIQQQGR